MKRHSLTTLFILSFSFCLGQDSTELPKMNFPKNYEIYSLPYKKYIPKYFLQILDSLNGTPLHLYDLNERIVGDNRISQKPKREITRFEKYPNAYLLTYKHRENPEHNHFVVFILRNNEYYKITTGITSFELDSILTLENKRNDKSVKFINPTSSTSKHKF